MKEHLKLFEGNILSSLQSNVIGLQQTGIQTLRDLEHIFPDYPFDAMLAPLETILKDTKADRVARRLAALALDELHSDAGDAVIKSIADDCDDGGLQSLCQALQVKNQNKQ